MNADILNTLKNLSAEEAVTLLDRHIDAHPDDDEAYLQRGLRHWALEHRAKAINDYLKAISINPRSKAARALESARAILDFYNKDLYNP